MPERDIDTAVTRVLAGDREQYRAVVEACEAPVRVIAAAMLPQGASVDDLVHEAFVTAYGKLAEYRPGTDFLAWLKAITRNLAHNERRRFVRQLGMQRRYRCEIEDLVTPAVDELADSASADVLGALRECVEGLADPARALVRRHYFDGVGYQELAEGMGKRSGWARLVLFRARAALARCLQTKGALADG